MQNQLISSSAHQLIKSLVFILIFISSSAWAYDLSAIQAKANYNDPDKKIENLRWQSVASLPLKFRSKPDGKSEIFVTIKGEYDKPDYSVLVNIVHKNKNEEKFFEDDIVLLGEVTPFNIDIIGPKGEITHAAFEIRLPEYENVKSALLEAQDSKKISGIFAMGPTFLNFKQTGEVAYNEWLWTVRAGGLYRLHKDWEVSVNSFLNTFATYSNRADAIRFFGANVRAGYVLQKPLSSFKITINGGWYYITSFGSSIGFQDLNGPQIYPAVNYKINQNESAFGYFKYSPIAKGLGLLSLTNRELAFGGGYNFKAFQQNLTIGLDVAFISITFPNTKMESTSLTGTLGIRF